VNFRQTPIFSAPTFVTFQHGRPVQYGRESTHKSRVARSNTTLGHCMQRDQHHQGDVGDLQRGLGEVSSCGLCRAKQLGDPSAFCASFLSMPTFCQRKHFVNASILSTPTFCLCQYFVYANIFQRLYFVGAVEDRKMMCTQGLRDYD
jgi:hypothetical protein